VSASPPDELDDRILREAPARLSLHRFEEERGLAHPPAEADAFVLGYLDGARGAALERAVDRRRPERELLAAFAYGWCRGNADLQGHKPRYDRVDAWLARRVGSRSGG